MIKAITFLGFLFTLFLLFIQCDTNEPPDNNNYQDTTSHNFTFQTWTFGEHSSSVLYDVAIINDSSIWAVGEIYLNDSLGQPDPTPYNSVYWDGFTWTVKRIPTKTFSGTTVSSQIRTIFAFSENNIWTFSIAGSYSHWNGSDWETEFVSEREGSGNKLWGTSSSNLYIVCNNGGITYYNGSSWQKIESGTDLNINDIWGITDQYGKIFILCPAYNFGTGGDKKLLSVNNNVISEIPWVENRELYTVWFKTTNLIFAGGEGLFYITRNQWNEITLPTLFKFRVRGQEINDIWTVGGYGFAAHYNGASWKTSDEVSLSAGNYLGLAVRENTVVMSGNEGSKAVVTIGKRLYIN